MKKIFDGISLLIAISLTSVSSLKAAKFQFDNVWDGYVVILASCVGLSGLLCALAAVPKANSLPVLRALTDCAHDAVAGCIFFSAGLALLAVYYFVLVDGYHFPADYSTRLAPGNAWGYLAFVPALVMMLGLHNVLLAFSEYLSHYLRYQYRRDRN